MYETLDWNDFSIQRSDNYGPNSNNNPYVYKVVISNRDKYLNPNQEIEFTINNLLHADDIYRDLFGSNASFYLEDKGQVLDKIKDAFGMNYVELRWKTLSTESDGSTTDVLEVGSTSWYFGLQDNNHGYDAFICSSGRDNSDRLVFRFTPKVAKDNTVLTPPTSNIISLTDASASRSDIYETLG